MARRTGGGNGAGSTGVGIGATRARTTVAAAERRVIVAPQAEQARRSWLIASHTAHCQVPFIGTDAYPGW